MSRTLLQQTTNRTPTVDVILTSIVLLLGRLLSASFLLFAAGMKGVTIIGLRLHTFRELSTASVQSLIVLFEAILGIALLANWAPCICRRVALGTFGIFFVLSAALAFAGSPSCGCLGDLTIAPSLMAALDGVLLAILTLGAWLSSRLGVTLGTSRLMAIASIVLGMLGLSAVSGLLYFGKVEVSGHRGITQLVDGSMLVQPERWLGSALPFEFFDIGDRLASGKWHIIMYSSGCSECLGSLGELTSRAIDRASTLESCRVALIETSGSSSLPSQVHRGLNHQVEHGRVISTNNWIMKTPAEIYIVDGRVLQVGSRHVVDK